MDLKRARTYYVLLNENEAKATMLNTLGQESDDSIMYNAKKKLYGHDIEERCDQWVQYLGSSSVFNFEDLFEKRLIFREGSLAGYHTELMEREEKMTH